MRIHEHDARSPIEPIGGWRVRGRGIANTETVPSGPSVRVAKYAGKPGRRESTEKLGFSLTESHARLNPRNQLPPTGVGVGAKTYSVCGSVCGGVNNAPRAAANTLPDPSTPHSGLSWAAVTWRSHLLRTTLVFALLDCLASC